MARGLVPELVADVHALLGEGPVWDSGRGVLWWVDILAGRVHCFDPAAGPRPPIDVGQVAGAVALRESGALLLLGRDGVLALDPETRHVATLLAFDPEEPPRRCNDAKPDPAGRLWLERMAFDHAPECGSLHRLGADLVLTTVLAGLTIPNGLAWSPDGTIMYFTESMSRTVTAYDFEPVTGAISGGRPFLRTGPEIGLPPGAVPDGLTVDAAGSVWVAVWGGGCVLCVDPDGRIAARIDFPVSQVSSCAFGGAELEDLYVTSAREDFTTADNVREPAAGGLFRVRPGVRGLPPHRFAG
jgi:sugar lactone lactonase YvrE